MRTRLLAALGVTGAWLITCSGAWPASARADVQPRSFTAVARADAVRAHFSATGFVASDLADTSGPTAQAKLDSLGDSEGFAALPYPGDTAVSGPGLIVALAAPQLGVPPPQLPSYPLAARSQFPAQRYATVDYGSLQLAAHSSEESSSARAVDGGSDSTGDSIGSAVAGSSVSVSDSGRLTSDAGATIQAVTVGDILRIGAMTSSAHAEATSNGKPTGTSTFSVEGVTVAGTPVGVDDQGFVMAGTHQPLPPHSSLAQALAASGISVAYLEPVTDGGTVQSGGLSVNVPQRTPTGNVVTVTYTFGVVRAGVWNDALPFLSSPAGSSAAPSYRSPGRSVAPVAGGPETSGADAAHATPMTAELPHAATIGRATPGGIPAFTRVRRSTTSAGSIYLLIALGGLMALGGTWVMRHVAVRFTWTS